MSKSRNNLLGVGGQRKKLSRNEQQSGGPAREADRKAAADQKQELLRKMRERAQIASDAEPRIEDAAPQPEGGAAPQESQA
ncbi:DUF6243 family protein [Streptomyces peucetius]|nr:hypothetical protein CGZ69_11345 [Streptomyces peucetius subsp. caesius ATCC 27952]